MRNEGAGNGHRHIAAIDGLRAVAVLAVIFYKLQETWLPGGFSGVDIFYVISGFVVAASVASAPDERLTSYLLWFYRRRVLRILPALAVFVLVITLLCVLFVPISNLSKFVEPTGFFSLFGMSNFILVKRIGHYFDAPTLFNPFAHTWSLAIEEQYYFLFPFFSYFILVNKRISERLRGVLLAGLAIGCLLSLGLCAVTSRTANVFAFYMLPPRFWELGLGFFLYFGLGRTSPQGWFHQSVAVFNRHSVLAYLSMTGIAASFWLCDSKAFPFPWAVLPCLATAGLIASTVSEQKNIVRRFLEHPITVYIGRISYSLYLWHYGVIVLMRWTVGIDRADLKIIAAILTALLAIGSYHFVEKPMRAQAWLSKASFARFYAMAACAMIGVAGTWAALYYSKPHIGLFATTNAQVWSAEVNPPAKADDCEVVEAKSNKWHDGELASFQPKACAKEQAAHVYVIGDSHAGAYRRLLHRLASEDGYAISNYNRGGCRPLNYVHDVVPGCDAFIDAAIKDVASQAKAGDVVFLPALYVDRYRNFWDSEMLKTSDLALAATPEDKVSAQQGMQILQPMLAKGVKVVMEAPKPVVQSAQFRCADWFNRISDYCQSAKPVPRDEMLLRRSRAMAFLEDVYSRSDAIVLWDPFDLLCPGAACTGYLNGKPYFYDTDHLSAFGNDLLYPSFRRELATVRGIATQLP